MIPRPMELLRLLCSVGLLLAMVGILAALIARITAEPFASYAEKGDKAGVNATEDVLVTLGTIDVNMTDYTLPTDPITKCDAVDPSKSFEDNQLIIEACLRNIPAILRMNNHLKHDVNHGANTVKAANVAPPDTDAP